MLVPNDIVGTGTVLSWMKKEGETFHKGEPLFEVETRKAIIQVEAPEAGTMLRISAKEGTAVISGSQVALYAVEGQQVPPELLKPASPATLVLKLLDDENRPVTEAKVNVDGQELEQGADGMLTIGGLAPAVYTIRIKAPGFLEKILVLKLGEGETANHELNLFPVRSLTSKPKDKD
jgi:pyruvate/2-oxoglutarate dehydrogenase complex dihydrolipoamide acyltransferase (E2) component